MNRDPENKECTRDPIFLLQRGFRLWTELPGGFELDDGGLYLCNGHDPDSAPEWIAPFINHGQSINASPEFWKEAQRQENSNGWPLVYVRWDTAGVFLTRPEAESFAERHSYNWDCWQVYCVCAEGELAQLLNQA